mmetsp:Transcript_45379/g.52199  ORF Transcript_45379/g.52199 Transcript_45379/m.52199 type:complete len:234 (-) Transcript_45379:88-789(-)
MYAFSFLTSTILLFVLVGFSDVNDSLRQKDIVLGLFFAQSVLGDLLESINDVCIVLGTGFKVRQISLLFGPSLSLSGSHLSFGFFIALVTQNNEREVFGILGLSLSQELFSPAFQILKGLAVGDVVNQDTAIGATVESNTQTLESFLAGSIPDLKSNHFVVNHDIFSQKIGSNSSFILLTETVVDELVHQRSLSDSTVSQDDNFEQVLLSVHRDLFLFDFFSLFSILYLFCFC